MRACPRTFIAPVRSLGGGLRLRAFTWAGWIAGYPGNRFSSAPEQRTRHVIGGVDVLRIRRSRRPSCAWLAVCCPPSRWSRWKGARGRRQRALVALAGVSRGCRCFGLLQGVLGCGFLPCRLWAPFQPGRRLHRSKNSGFCFRCIRAVWAWVAVWPPAGPGWQWCWPGARRWRQVAVWPGGFG